VSIKDDLKKILEPPKPEKMTGPKAPKRRTLGDVYTALEAQRIYNPGMPSIPKPAPANLMDQGVAPNLGTEGAWGGGNQRKD
jgi:hypothetical protein